MSFSIIPAQEDAVKYLNLVSANSLCPIRFCGHSKGENLAIYAAIKCYYSVRRRIIDIYSHDGPGFLQEIYDLPEYFNIKNKIHKTVLKSSIVGNLMYQQEECTFVESAGRGLIQHNPFNWFVENNQFRTVLEVKERNLNINKTINEWLLRLDSKRGKEFIDVLYDIISDIESENVFQFTANWVNDSKKYLKRCKP